MLSNRYRCSVSGVFRLNGLSSEIWMGSDDCPCDHQLCWMKYLGNLDLGIRKPYLKCQMCHGNSHHAYVCLGLAGLHKIVSNHWLC